MSLIYKAISWNRQKKLYDYILAICIFVFLTLFVSIGIVKFNSVSIMTLLIRATAFSAFVLIHIILSIGPLTRLNSKYLPLLYNRRHLGVIMFLLSFLHAFLVVLNYYSFGDTNPILSIFVTNQQYSSLSQFPFELLGVVALAILFIMAITSHDFWLSNLTAPIWKSIHMSVYVAYSAIIIHVVLGFLQSELSPIITAFVFLGFLWILFLHLISGVKEYFNVNIITQFISKNERAWLKTVHVSQIKNNCAKIVEIKDERVAIFKQDKLIFAISNVCQHQNGPLGEGKIINGCVTCPWHGYQYEGKTGKSPAPFTEEIPTFNVSIQNGWVYVDPFPNPLGVEAKVAYLEEDYFERK